MIPLFVYGTLRDEEYQRALFDRVFPPIPARLTGWMVVVAESGYFTIVESAQAHVDGALLELDDAALALADRWEDVPVYERRNVIVDVAGKPRTAFVYVRKTALREPPPSGVLATHDREHVLAAIRACRRT
jgi:gamma-glutamylcyclotransferase (GGCT)/AIG2-like uncharacterized protein YtfP